MSLISALLALVLLAGCAVESAPVREMKHYALDSLDGLVSRDGVALDAEVSSDGGGSLRVKAGEPRTVLLFETGDLDVENARLVYQAKLRTEDVQGKVYLEMWCDFQGKGEFFSRALDVPLSGTTDWASQQTPFFLRAGENPDNVRLNLVVEGTGTVWIDDIRVTMGPLG